MKIWVFIVVLLLLACGLVVGGIFVYKSIGTPKESQNETENIGIFDISQNCAMEDPNQVKECCKNICLKYCKETSRKYSNHYLNNNNEITSCYCWCG